MRGWFGLVLVGALIGSSLVGGLFQSVESRLQPSAELGIEIEPEVEEGDVWNLLVVGSDRRLSDEARNVRADSVWLVRLDPDRGELVSWSLPRDWIVKQPGYGTDRLATAFSRGGLELVVETVEGATDVDVDGVVVARFDAFSRLVNRLDCLLVDVDRRYLNVQDGSRANNYAEIDLQAGYQRLCGQDALSFARHRYSDNDLYRSLRQLRILEAAKSQWGSRKLVSSPDTLLDLLAYVSTTIPAKDQLNLGRTLIQMPGASLRKVEFEGESSGTALVSSKEQKRKMHEDWLGGSDETDSSGGDSSEGDDSGESNRQRSRELQRRAPELKIPVSWRSLGFEGGSVRVPSDVRSLLTRSYELEEGPRAFRLVLSLAQNQAAGVQWVGRGTNEGVLPPDRKAGCGGWWWISNSLDNQLSKKDRQRLLGQVNCSWLPE
jgi:LCP family protein required for cell wall assembly